MDQINASMIRHAWQVAEEIKANAVMVYVDVVQSKEKLESLLRESHCILAARDKNVLEELESLDARQNKTESPPNRLKDREQVLEMLAKVGDQFSLSIYKKVHSISENDMTPHKPGHVSSKS